MRRSRLGAAALAMVLPTVISCGAETADYQSLWSTPSTTTPSASEAPAPVSIAEYLESVGVTGRPVAPENLADLTVTMPMPPGWRPYVSTDFAPGTRVIAKGDTYPTAMLMVFELHGDFDVKQAVSHGDADAERSQNFNRLNASDDNWRGFPSSMIEGSYDLNGRRMHSYNRIVIATGSPPANHRYLVQFTVTSYADRAAEEAPDIEEVISGFTVAAR